MRAAQHRMRQEARESHGICAGPTSVSRGTQVDHGAMCETEANELRRFLVDLIVAKRISDKDACLLAHHVTKAGGAGIADLAVDPNSAGENYGRHLIAVLGLRNYDEKTYMARVLFNCA